MNVFKQLALRGYMEEAGDKGEGGSAGDGGGTSGTGDGGDKGTGDKGVGDEGDKGKRSDDKGDGDLSAQLEKEKAEKAALLKETMQRKDKVKELEKAQTEKDKEIERLKKIEDEQKKKDSDDKLKKLEADKDHEAVKKHLIEQHTQELEAEREKIKKESADRIKELQEQNDNLLAQMQSVAMENAFADLADLQKDFVMPKSAAKGLFGDHIEFKDGKIFIYNKPVSSPDKIEITDGQGVPKTASAAFLDLIKQHPDHDQYKRSEIKPGSGRNTNSNLTPSKEEKPKTGLELISKGLQDKQKASGS